MLCSSVQSVHTVLVLREASENRRAAGRAATHGRVAVLENEATLSQRVQVGRLAVRVSVD